MTIQNAVQKANWLVEQGRSDEAIATIKTAIAEDDVDALYQYAVWLLVGDILDRDLPLAISTLTRADQIGHADATLLLIALTASDAEGQRAWQAAYSLLKKAASNCDVARRHLYLLNKMAIGIDGSPAQTSKAMRLCNSPAISYFKDFLSPDECAHIAQVATPLFVPSTVVDPETGQHILNLVRTSDAATIGPANEDLVIGAINRRIAAASNTHISQGEPLTVLHYRPGQQYRPHLDTLHNTDNQRIRTFIIYLNDAFEGGETRFPIKDILVKPIAGDAIMFDTVVNGTTPDPKSLHEGLPVTTGAKWIATRWIRRAPFDPWGMRNSE